MSAPADPPAAVSLEAISLEATDNVRDDDRADSLNETVPLSSPGPYVPEKTESLKGMAFNLANSTIGAGAF
jgi:hypothetical protein